MLYCAVLYSAVLYCAVLCCAVLCCTVLCCAVPTYLRIYVGTYLYVVEVQWKHIKPGFRCFCLLGGKRRGCKVSQWPQSTDASESRRYVAAHSDVRVKSLYR